MGTDLSQLKFILLIRLAMIELFSLCNQIKILKLLIFRFKIINHQNNTLVRSNKENGLSSEILLSSRSEVSRRPSLKTVGKAKRLQVEPTTFQPNFLCCGGRKSYTLTEFEQELKNLHVLK
jgi:hypothetical protein